jgi:hypothetical protein
MSSQVVKQTYGKFFIVRVKNPLDYLEHYGRAEKKGEALSFPFSE